jgi:DNA-binding NtrC family response regulator
MPTALVEPRGTSAAAVPAAPASGARLLLVTPPSGVREAVLRWTDGLPIQVTVAPDRVRAARHLANEVWDVVVVSPRTEPAAELQEWTEALKRVEPSPRLVALVDRPAIDLVVASTQNGQAEILSQPPTRIDFLRALRVVQPVPLERTSELSTAPSLMIGSHALVGQSASMLEVFKDVARVAPSRATVLIEGESGTGKEVIARFIHTHGPSASGPFVAVNCAAIPETLLESELFGHERGAFTGAHGRVLGKVEQADGGSLFLDEIAEMSQALQAKLLRVIQERTFERVGGREAIRVNVRVIAATNRDVDAEVRARRLREDLYYRLAVVRIKLPRLADRGEDLLLLASHFVRDYSERYAKRITRISDGAVALLRRHTWNGNVRELENVIERAVILATGDLLRAEHLPEGLRVEPAPAAAQAGGELTLRELERRHIAEVLTRTDGHLGRAAALLGVHRNTLSRKVRELGL